MPTNQKAEARPISFLLHDTRGKDPIEEVKLIIRPEELTRTDVSRLAVHQTFGGAWADNWGPGIPALTLAGHTGWGANGRPDGLKEFQRLHSAIFERWHSLRNACVTAGDDPDKIKLIFADRLDDFTWVVAPNSFVLRRNRQRPLLSMYQITMVKLADHLLEKPEQPPKQGLEAAVVSLDASIQRINDFAASIRGKMQNFLGPIAEAVRNFVKLTASVLGVVRSLIAAGMSVVQAVTAPLIDLARDMARGAFNVMAIVSSVKDVPMQIKAELMRVGGAYANVFCLMKNVFKTRRSFPSYDSLYGASLCSSTSGGRPVSTYSRMGANAFQEIYSGNNRHVSASPQAAAGIKNLAAADPITSGTTVAELGPNLRNAVTVRVRGVA